MNGVIRGEKRDASAVFSPDLGSVTHIVAFVYQCLRFRKLTLKSG
jgi:hypothetical protein